MKILVVEDEHRIANSIQKGLEQEKFTVDVAYTGTDGYDMASTDSYDLIVLDLMLPGLDGLAICQKLRSDNIHTPILILTAKGEVNDKVVGLNNGADDYLPKPFAFAELLARIRALLRRPPVSADTVLTFEDITFNSTSYLVTRAGKKIRLSRKEFSLMDYLMRHPGQVLSKQQLIDHVWNYDADILPNTVEVYIKSLRRKLGPPGLIHTVRGFGYKLDHP